MPQSLPFWQKEATYRYYLHGPLARVELGDILVQGIDYAYTLQGWLKGVNSNNLDPRLDMGNDGMPTAINEKTGRDAFGFTLGYFSGDYEPIDIPNKWDNDPVPNRFEAVTSGSQLLANREDLWNGNIGHMATSLYAPPGSDGGGTTGANLIQGMAYKYDQLNRLKDARAFNNFNSAANSWSIGTVYDDRYYNDFTYDPNGNILHQNRYDEDGVQFDDMTYRYALNMDSEMYQNRLYHVNDNTLWDALKPDDIDDQGTYDLQNDVNNSNNYAYDQIGQLTRDDAEDIAGITWRVDGKISRITRSAGSTKKNLIFVYNSMGQRVAKKVLSSSNVWEETTYYVHDASGNVMSTYTHTSEGETASLELSEQHLYGSSRLGMKTPELEMIGATNPDELELIDPIRGIKSYELSNHLGNVLSVVTDQKLPHNNSGDVDYYLSEVISYTDYYPFGAPMEGRTWDVGYRFGLNGVERDNDLYGNGNSYNTFFRQNDPRLGRWLSNDPVVQHWQSPYSSMDNNPIVFSDPFGDKIITENRNQRRLFKREMKNRGDWNAIKRKYRGNRRDLHVVERNWSTGSMGTAEIESNPRNTERDTFKNQDWFVYGSGEFIHGDDLAGKSNRPDPINPITPISITNLPTNIVPRGIVQPMPLPLVIPLVRPMPARVNFNINAPFVGGQVIFSNPVQGNVQLQNAANAFLTNPNATQIIIVIGTSTVNLNQQSTNPGMNMRQLLTARGRFILNQMLALGVPLSAFQSNWLQFAPGTTIGTIVRVR